jgi:hypothetical protein
MAPAASLPVPIYKLSETALKALFGDETVDMHISRSWFTHKGNTYKLPPDLLRARTLKLLLKSKLPAVL